MISKNWLACVAGFALLIFWGGGSGKTLADELQARASIDTGRLNVKSPTLGGMQFWSDTLVLHDWRIQRNVLTGHHRLLDGKNWRHAWGSFAQCKQRLDQIARDQRLPAVEGKAVVVLHGLLGTRGRMAKLARVLREQGGYTVINVGYASSRGSVADHARDLASVIDHLDEVDEINFVAHSLGNLVIRHYLADATDVKRGRRPDGRIRRIVMLGPPNHGAELAYKLAPLDVTRQIVGAATQEIARGWPALERRLATPDCEFGILAGGAVGGGGHNPLISGDDDLIVSVATTRLAGARDYRVLPVWHPTMMNDPKVQACMLKFLEHGYFESAASRLPIEAER